MKAFVIRALLDHFKPNKMIFHIFYIKFSALFFREIFQARPDKDSASQPIHLK